MPGTANVSSVRFAYRSRSAGGAPKLVLATQSAHANVILRAWSRLTTPHLADSCRAASRTHRLRALDLQQATPAAATRSRSTFALLHPKTAKYSDGLHRSGSPHSSGGRVRGSVRSCARCSAPADRD